MQQIGQTDAQANDGYSMDTLRAHIEQARTAAAAGDQATLDTLSCDYDCTGDDVLACVEAVAREWCYQCGVHVSRVGL